MIAIYQTHREPLDYFMTKVLRVSGRHAERANLGEDADDENENGSPLDECHQHE